ncbi:MAG: hypothetical protein ACJAX3_001777 [Patiriisocius sp.]|jgi:hypothetical protein
MRKILPCIQQIYSTIQHKDQAKRVKECNK